jgi:hypothetical protein
MPQGIKVTELQMNFALFLQIWQNNALAGSYKNVVSSISGIYCIHNTLCTKIMPSGSYKNAVSSL